MSFGCAFGDQKDDHHFVRVKASKMNVFAHHQVMPGIPPNQASMLSTLMAAARAKAVGFLRFLNDDENELKLTTTTMEKTMTSCWKTGSG